MRKIIQVSAMADTANNEATIIALCDDGTVWEITADNQTEDSEGYYCWRQWRQLPTLPPKNSQP